MSKPFKSIHHRSISIRLAWIGILVVIFVGLVTSAISLYLDFKKEVETVNARLEVIMDSSEPAVSRAIYTLDNALAEEVVTGLLNYQTIASVSITDELGEIMARGSIDTPNRPSRIIDALSSGLQFDYERQILLPGTDLPAVFRLSLDENQVFAGFLGRVQLSILNSFIQGLATASFLFGAFYFFLVKPLNSIAGQIKKLDPTKPDSSLVDIRKRDPDDELALVVDSTNDLLGTIKEALKVQHKVETELRDSERQLREVVDGMPIMVAAFNDRGEFHFANKSFMAMAELESIANLNKTGVQEFLSRDLSYSEEVSIDVLDDLFTESKRVQLPDTQKLIRDRQLSLQVECVSLELYGRPAGLLVIMDISALRSAQKDIEYMAYRDSLTNLPNRYSLIDQLSSEVEKSCRSGMASAAIYVDLDRFKSVNDLMGHAMGDMVLRETARRLQRVVGIKTFVARVSGDEFMIVLPEISEDRVVCADKAQELGKKIIEVVSEPVIQEKTEVRVTASLGILLFPDSAGTAADILKRADTAMFEVKRGSREGIAFFDEGLSAQLERQWRLEQELIRAFEQGEFEVYYQPKVTIENSALMGIEALLRWRHPKRGLVPAGLFIDVLQSMAIFSKVSDWAKSQALRQVCKWKAEGCWVDGMRVSLNVSPAEFISPSFRENIISLVQDAGAEPGMVEFEVLESAAFEDLETAEGIMNSLVSEGFRFALDDFGTGFSSMHCLRQLPLSILKIDKSFIHGLGGELNDGILVEAVIGLAQLLDLEVVAEGVEGERELSLLKAYGCEYYQGYYFSAPVDALQMRQLLEAQRVGMEATQEAASGEKALRC